MKKYFFKLIFLSVSLITTAQQLSYKVFSINSVKLTVTDSIGRKTTRTDSMDCVFFIALSSPTTISSVQNMYLKIGEVMDSGSLIDKTFIVTAKNENYSLVDNSSNNKQYSLYGSNNLNFTMRIPINKNLNWATSYFISNGANSVKSYFKIMK